MFKNFRTSTKLTILCSIFVISIAATVYSLVVEKQIAIEFARKEQIGSRHMTVVRNLYAAALTNPPIGRAATPRSHSETLLQELAVAEASWQGLLKTKGLAASTADIVSSPSSSEARDLSGYALTFDVFAKSRQFAARIADDSNLSLDPDLNSYHLQEVTTRKLPEFLNQLGSLHLALREAAEGGVPSTELTLHVQTAERQLRTIADELRDRLAAAYRGDADGRLQQRLDHPFISLTSNARVYSGAMSGSIVGGQLDADGIASLDRLFSNVVETAMAAWAAAQSELDRLLQARIDGLMGKMLWSLGVISLLTVLSIWIAIMTHRYTVRPLEKLEEFASAVRTTKDYSLRIDDSSTNEIGQLAATFNDMLSELAVAREREHAEQAQHARAARLMTAGAMTASIAHEINQPLASIVASSNAAQRWLARPQPNIQQAQTALERIARDGHRASDVIASVRALFKKENRPSDRLAVNDIIRDTLSLVRVEAESNGIRIRTELTEDLPPVIADRGQLQQVLVNLFSNAAEAMRLNHDRQPVLTIRSGFADAGAISVVVEDTGVGIDPKDMQRIFDTFYTTKSGGMGMGLSICRSIVEAHGGQLWASRRADFGSAFHLTLPVVDGDR